MEKRFKRVKRVNDTPNPLFMKWLKEWRDDAFKKGLKTHHTYSKALKSLAKYPLVLKSGRDARILEFFGDKICNMLDKKIAESGDIPLSANSSESELDTVDIVEMPSKKKKSRKVVVSGYTPSIRSGPYAILLTLYNKQLDGIDSLAKKDLIEWAQPLCKSSFSVPSAGSFYTAWSCMGDLITRKLVIKMGHPARYMLTGEGIILAEALAKVDAEKNRSDAQDSANFKEGETNLTDSSQPKLIPVNDESRIHDSVYLLPEKYDIVLLVDVAETNSSTGFGIKNSKSMLIPELRKNGVNFEVRKLNVGDFAWIAKEKVDLIPGCLEVQPAKELVLDFIIERKRMDDLASSIKDGRFHEQKFRLANCGLCRPIYLIEKYNSAVSLPENSLHQAVTNTQILNDFTVRYVNDCKESFAFLTILTRHLMKIYNGKNLFKRSVMDNKNIKIVQPNCYLLLFNEFNSGSIKNKQMSVGGMFLRSLMAISGVSSEKAVAIVKQYPTVRNLCKAYESCETLKEKENLLSKVKYSNSQRNLGPATSKIICMLYCLDKIHINEEN